MKLRIETARLRAVVARVVKACGPGDLVGSILMALDGNDLTLTATDYEAALRIAVECEGLDDGIILPDGAALTKALTALPDGTATVETDGDKLRVECGRARYMLVTRPVDAAWGDPFEDFELGQSTVIGTAQLAAALKTAMPFVADDASRPTINGILLRQAAGGVDVAATTGLFLSINHLECPTWTARELLVHRRGLALIVPELANAGSTELAVLTAIGSRLVVKVGQALVLARQIDGKFPDYLRVVPTETDRIVQVDGAALRAAVRRMAVLLNKAVADPLRLRVGGNVLELSSHSGLGSEAFDAVELVEPWPYAAVSLQLSASRLATSLADMGDLVEIRLPDDDLGPVRISRPDSPLRAVLMPMRDK